MKRISIRVATIIISLLPSVVPVLAEVTGSTEAAEQLSPQKDECLLAARNCGNSIMSIQDKIERLKEEIAKGRAVYTREELNNLKQKLEEVSKTLDFLLDK